MPSKHSAFRVIVFLAATCAIFAACSDAPYRTVTSNKPTLSAVPTVISISPVQPIDPTATLQSETPTVEITPAFVKNLGQTPIEQRCLEVKPSPPSDTTFPGVAVLSVISPSQNGPRVYLLDLSANARLQLLSQDGEPQYGHSVSPNRKWLAYSRHYQDGSPYLLVIADALGQVDKTIIWDKAWISLLGWLNNDRLLITEENGILVFDPFTGQQETLGRDYPDLYDYPPPVNWDSTDTVYDPGLSRVVYPLRRPDDGGAEIALWDITQQHILASLPNITHYGRTPKWSSSGDSVIVTGVSQVASPDSSPTEDIFRIDRDGQITRLTYFSENNQIVEIGNYSWSPDDRYLAFWIWAMTEDYSAGDHLAVLDLHTMEVVDYCILGNSGGFGSSPVWSPDGRYILVESHESNRGNGRAILIDLVGIQAIQISQDMKPIGWMVAP